MNIERLKITPKQAQEILRGNSRNRPANKAHIARLAGEMSSGKWKFNGSTISVTTSGLVVDGQHRLKACAVSQVPFETIMITGLDPGVFDTIDVGKKRTAADTFAVKGEKNYSLLAASLVIVELYMSGHDGGRLTRPASNQDYEEWLEKYPALPASVEIAVSYRTKLMQPSILAAAHYIFSRIDEHAALDFIKRLATGENIKEGSVMSKLREKLIENFTSPRKHERAYLFGLLIKAWNAERTGRTLLRFRVTSTEYQDAEAFPVAI